MNQFREWEGSCQRCYAETMVYTMSMFDVSLICPSCAESEKNHPDYDQARLAEEAAVKKGNLNFPGIGFTRK